jgi:SAM-dependent methyltransferase
MDATAHWDAIYRANAPDSVSWFRQHLEISLTLIQRAAPERNASIIDVGAGESTLVDDLLGLGYSDLTLFDISRKALEITRKRLGPSAERVHWLHADITVPGVLNRTYTLWHDRAVFHFLTRAEDRVAYVQNVMRSVNPGGHVIVSTFGPQGPRKCSGLDVVRYDAESLHEEFGARFLLVDHATELHRTPSGSTQQFIYCYCRIL